MAKRCYVKHLGSCTFELFFFFGGVNLLLSRIVYKSFFWF